MPVLTVSIDGAVVAAVRCDDFHVVNARVHGSLVEAPFATVELTASTHPEVGEGTYLIWLNEHELKPAQMVAFHLLPEGETIGVGQTIDQLFPEDDDGVHEPSKSADACFKELRAKPNLRSRYMFSASTPTHPDHSSSTSPGEYSFSFSALWNWLRPNRAGISLSTWTIDSVEFNTPSREHLREYIQPSQGATLRVDA